MLLFNLFCIWETVLGYAVPHPVVVCIIVLLSEGINAPGRCAIEGPILYLKTHSYWGNHTFLNYAYYYLRNL